MGSNSKEKLLHETTLANKTTLFSPKYSLDFNMMA